MQNGTAASPHRPGIAKTRNAIIAKTKAASRQPERLLAIHSDSVRLLGWLQAGTQPGHFPQKTIINMMKIASETRHPIAADPHPDPSSLEVSAALR